MRKARREGGGLKKSQWGTLLFRRDFDFDGGAKFVLAGIADPRVTNAALAAKLGGDRGEQHFSATRTGRTT